MVTGACFPPTGALSAPPVDLIQTSGALNANVKAAQTVRDIAAAHHVKPAQIALAWLLHKGSDVVPIPGTKRRKYLEENMAAESVRLDPAQMKALDETLSPGKIQGKRYNEKIMATIDR